MLFNNRAYTPIPKKLFAILSPSESNSFCFVYTSHVRVIFEESTKWGKRVTQDVGKL